MDWTKFFRKVALSMVQGATASTAGIAAAPGVDVNSPEGMTTVGMVTLLVSGLTALSNYLKHK